MIQDFFTIFKKFTCLYNLSSGKEVSENPNPAFHFLKHHVHAIASTIAEVTQNCSLAAVSLTMSHNQQTVGGTRVAKKKKNVFYFHKED